MSLTDQGGSANNRGLSPRSNRPRLSREFVLEQRRHRIAASVAQLAHEVGIAEVTVSTVCRLAGTSRATVYQLFDGASACKRYAFTHAFDVTFAPAWETDAEEGSWL